jgi:hypothetical protein
MRKLVLAGIFALVLAAGEANAGEVFVRFGPPPPPRREIIVARPDPRYVWVPGYYGWRRSHYHWVRGYWALPPRPRAVWVPGYWMPRRGGHIWIAGYWRY